MVKIRLQGTKEELEKSLKILKSNFNVLQISAPYNNRDSQYIRIYLDIELKPVKG